MSTLHLHQTTTATPEQFVAPSPSAPSPTDWPAPSRPSKTVATPRTPPNPAVVILDLLPSNDNKPKITTVLRSRRGSG